jgi:hypothetical protein
MLQIYDFWFTPDIPMVSPWRLRQWQLAETCGLPLAALAAEFATLPEIISRGGLDIMSFK